MSLPPGTRLHGRFTLVEPIGSGGMGQVWRALDTVLDRPVAVKVLAAPLAADPTLRAATWQEARAAARLAHPHVTQVYDYGEAPLPDGATVPYLVMELVKGQDLATRLAGGALPWREAARVGGQIAAGLAAAHGLGVVHRDVKPGNVMLTDAGAKVLDFGIAALTGTRADAERDWLVGTPTYTAPERLEPGPAQPASDVYSLGVLLYETLTGHPPARLPNWPAAITAHRAGLRVPPPRVPGLPPDVATLCLSCLSTDPAARPTAARVAGALAEAAHGGAVPVGGTTTGPAETATGLAETATGPVEAARNTADGTRSPALAGTPVGYARGTATVTRPAEVTRPADRMPAVATPRGYAGPDRTMIDRQQAPAVIDPEDRPDRTGGGRRAGLAGLGVAAVVAALVFTLAATMRSGEPDTTTGSGADTAGATTAGPAGPAGPDGPPATATPLPGGANPPGTQNPARIIAALEQRVTEALIVGAIDESDARKLRKILQGLRNELNKNDDSEDDRRERLRDKAEDFLGEVDELRDDGAIDSATAGRLTNLLTPLVGGPG